MAKPDPNYDFLALYPDGIVPTRATLDCLAASYAANNFQPLNETQIEACTGAPPPYPTSIRRSPDCTTPPREGLT